MNTFKKWWPEMVTVLGVLWTTFGPQIAILIAHYPKASVWLAAIAMITGRLSTPPTKA